jgi:hypothetical protein
MNQTNEPSELETKLSSNAIDAVIKVFDLGMSPQQLQEFKEQAIKDAKAISLRHGFANANEWELERSEFDDNNQP